MTTAEKTATEKLRRANLLTALADEGLTGAKARAAARLLDDVEFDDDDEPTNLKDAIKAATAEYGKELFGVAAGTHAVTAHQGLTANELKAARASGMTPEEYVAYKSPHPEVPAAAPRRVSTADELRAAKAAGMTPEEYESERAPR